MEWENARREQRERRLGRRNDTLSNEDMCSNGNERRDGGREGGRGRGSPCRPNSIGGCEKKEENGIEMQCRKRESGREK